MTDWFKPVYTRFECCRYTANRIVSIRYDDKNDKRHWLHHIHASNPDQIGFLHDIFKPVYSMYVSGVTFDWKTFMSDFGKPLPVLNRKEFSEWNNENLESNIYDYILGKDITFDVDRHENISLLKPALYSLKIIDYLHDKGIDQHTIFSGDGGYHVVVENGEKLFGDYGIEQTAESVQALSYCAIEVASRMLDEIFDDTYVDQQSKGRSYDDVDIHFSPMQDPKGVRKAAYSLTDYGTVSLPVGRKELETVDDPKYYSPRNILDNYKIVKRGWVIK